MFKWIKDNKGFYASHNPTIRADKNGDVYGGGIITTFTFTSDVETVTRTKLNNLVANLKTEFNGSIDNSNIKASAGIIGSKLDLSEPGIIGGTTPAAGTFTTGTFTTLNITSMGSNWTNAGRTVADMGILTTVDINGGTWQGTIDGNWTAASQTCADLGLVTTADINGGTLDGVQIGGTTATGELIVNNSSDEADGLGDQGTSGEVLQSAGAGANPVWAVDINTSNVIFAWSGNENLGSGTRGMYVGTGSINPNVATDNAVAFMFIATNDTTTETFLRFRFTKISGVSTVSIHARTASRSGDTCTVTVDIGGASNTVTSTSGTRAWRTATDIDVSGLSDGTTYDGIVQLQTSVAGGGNEVFLYAITLIGS